MDAIGLHAEAAELRSLAPSGYMRDYAASAHAAAARAASFVSSARSAAASLSRAAAAAAAASLSRAAASDASFPPAVYGASVASAARDAARAARAAAASSRAAYGVGAGAAVVRREWGQVLVAASLSRAAASDSLFSADVAAAAAAAASSRDYASAASACADVRREWGQVLVAAAADAGLDIADYRVPRLDAALVAAIDSGAVIFDMRDWHPCETTGCRAGCACIMAGAAAAELEHATHPAIVGALVYAVSTGTVPDLYSSTDIALADMRRAAAAD